jgi:site-specific recombinase XerD
MIAYYRGEIKTPAKSGRAIFAPFACLIGGRHKVRDELLIVLLYQTGLRISEALSLTPGMIGTQDGKAVLCVVGKGRKPRMVACPDSLAHRLKSFAYDCGIIENSSSKNIS